MVHQGGQGALAEASSGLRGVAVALTKIANDIRLLASGPAAGLGELLLPELQAGSSIMPGKVNPVLCESVNQVAARVMGNDVTVGYAASQGILELNTYLPVIADALLESATLLANVAATFAERCVAGIEVDEVRARAATPSGRRRWPRRSTRSSATSGRRRSSRRRRRAGVRSSTSSSPRACCRPTRLAAFSTRYAPPASTNAGNAGASWTFPPHWHPSVDTGRGAARQEVGDQLVTAAGEDALGVELHALDVVMAVAHAHHRAVVSGGRDGELGGDRVGDEGQRVVARPGQRRRQAGEHTAAVVGDLRRLAVHQRRRPGDRGAVGVADRLMAEAHAEHRDVPRRRTPARRRRGSRRPRADPGRVRAARHRVRGRWRPRRRWRRCGGRSARRRARRDTARG